MAELGKWLKHVDWDKYVDDAQVQELASKLKQRIDHIDAERSEKAGEAGNSGSPATPAATPATTEDFDLQGAHRIKLVAVGDGAVGKTSLLMTFASGEFPTKYVPTVFQNTSAKTEFQGEKVLLQLWDTAGQEEYDRLRPLSYPGTDVVLLVFSLVSQSSLVAIREKWFPEVSHYAPKVPLILVGNKADLREAKAVDPITKQYAPVLTADGEGMAKEIGAVKYLEVSAMTRKNLVETFHGSIAGVFQVRGVTTGGGGKGGKGKKSNSKGCVLF